MLMGTWDRHCPNCFSEKTEGRRQCQFCGYDEGESRSPAALPLRTILNNQYVLGQVLGNPGGFGIAYLGWDIKLATRVAIKEFMPRDNAVRNTDQYNMVAYSDNDQEFFEYGLKAFLAEARTVAGFDHPNIVRVRNYFEQNHTAYLVMDYYEGVSLAEYVRQQGGRLPEKAALGITGFLLDGLQHVHNSGYLHRDVKPANIYLTGNGQVILLDFGAARYAMGEYSRSLSVVVTPGFSPFEQYSTKGKQGPWTDIYASGATLYYMLTGNLPESAPDRVLSDTLAEPGLLLPDLPPSINKGIMQALRVKASDRPQCIEELNKILSGSPQPDPAVNIKKTEEKSDSRDKRKEKKKPAIPLWRRKPAIAIGACILMLLAGVYGVCILVLLAVVYRYWGRYGKFGSIGAVIIRVKTMLAGYMPQRKTVEVVSGRETSVKMNMSPTGRKIGEMWNDPVTGMVFVRVPGGCYQMGCDSRDGDCQSDETPVHEVCVDGFWIGQTVVTQVQWQRVMGNNPSKFKKENDIPSYPVENVSWNDTKEYIRKLNGMGSGNFRLPSEAEWEYAARSGGKAEKYSGGGDVNSVAWHRGNCYEVSTHPVKTKKGNGLGIHDMSGNVWEWCEDVYIADIYGRYDRKNPIYTRGGPYRVIRGGSWYNLPDRVRCTSRYRYGPAFRDYYVGFRLLRVS
jgi:formylglycine-generating enzyme required for sulfatase activity/serine/threonine protein kinase